MTYNPQWPKVQAALLPWQHPEDRPDVLARAFKLKLQQLLNDLKQGHALGSVRAIMHVIEFQIGLPHAHITVTVEEGDVSRNADALDAVICAELPDPEREPELYKAVMEFMLHGPCGMYSPLAPCMRALHCSKDYRKQFREITMMEANSYFLYWCHRRQFLACPYLSAAFL
jgi:Helitron helicase-like domain at N-terminus